jgi:transcriptional regulator with XRE-family HTH domain
MPPVPPHPASGRPVLAQELLGQHLRLLRESRRISREQAARHIRGSDTKISRIELGRNRVSDTDLDGLLTLYRLEPEQCHAVRDLAAQLTGEQWWHEYADVLNDGFCSYLALEAIAERIRTYEARFVPGLLQTRAYAEAVFRLHYPPAQVRRLVNVRQQRQRRMLDRGRPRLWAIIDENALYEDIGPPEIMREQIDFLIRAVTHHHIPIQILQRGNGALTGVGTSFSLLRLPITGLADVVYLEQIAGALITPTPDQSDPHRIAMERLSQTAAKPKDTLFELKKARRQHGLKHPPA